MEEKPLFERVLLIEDDESHTFLIKRALKEYAQQIVAAKSLTEGLAELEAAPAFDLIVTDLNLPDSTAVEHVTVLTERGKDVPVVVLTSSTSLSEAVEAMRRGARDFVVKNFDNEFPGILGMALSRVYATLTLERERLRFQHQIELLKVAIENSKDGFAVIHDSAEIEYANSSFRAFMAHCGGDEHASTLRFTSRVAKGSALNEALRKRLTELPPGGVWHTEVTVNGEKEFTYDLSVSMIREADAGSRELVVWVRDVTEEKRKDKFQREILATTTHDLKGPLGSILISSDLIADATEEGSRTHEIALRITSSARATINLIDEFLSARRIQEGTFVLKPVQVELSSLIEQVFDDYEAIAKARRILLSFEAREQAPQVTVDPLGIKRVVGNLLSNALKFTAPGGTVTVRAFAEGDHAHIEVCDTGSGMEPSEVQKIFERFSRLSKHVDVDGSGIGLFVVKSVVAAHGGYIEVTSQLGKGTTFDIVLPPSPPVNARGELISLDFA